MKHYKHLVIDDSLPAPTLGLIQQLEEVLGGELPLPFVRFLQVGNGGTHEYVVDLVDDEDQIETMSFGTLFATTAGPNHFETFFEMLEQERGGSDIPLGILPIARDGGGSALFLDCRETELYGQLIAWIEPLPDWAGGRQGGFAAVADSFDDYIEGLYIERDYARELWHDANEAGDTQRIDAVSRWLDIGIPGWRHHLIGN